MGAWYFFSRRRKSNELWIGTREGIETPRSVERIPVQQRWGEDCVNWVQFAPWRRYKDAVEADGDLPEGGPVEERVEAQNRGTVMIETRQRAPRVLYITLQDAGSMATPKGVEDALVGLEDWEDNHTLMYVGRGLEKHWLRM